MLELSDVCVLLWLLETLGELIMLIELAAMIVMLGLFLVLPLLPPPPQPKSIIGTSISVEKRITRNK